jgi:hypothetical protein
VDTTEHLQKFTFVCLNVENLRDYKIWRECRSTILSKLADDSTMVCVYFEAHDLGKGRMHYTADKTMQFPAVCPGARHARSGD